MTLSKINGEMTDEDVEKVLKHFDDAKALMDFLTAITEDKRIQMEKKKRKPMNFIKHTQIHLESHPEFMPGEAAVPEFQRIVNLHNNLRRIDAVVDLFHKEIKDTITVLESEAYSLARIYYKTVRDGAKEGQPEAERIYNDLSHYFKAKHKRKNTSETSHEEQTKA